MSLAIQPVILYGRILRLVPLEESHASLLYQAGNYESIWRFMRYGMIQSEAQMSEWVRSLLAAQAHGTDLPFVVIHQATGKVVGTTRYLEIQLENRALEIGGTWYTPAYQRTAVNTESKYLLLRHAFEILGCVRVQFKTDLRNERSQKALERIGAVKEGVLRNHMILPDGSLRTSVFYSILDGEWPGVKTLLEEKLNNPPGP